MLNDQLFAGTVQAIGPGLIVDFYRQFLLNGGA